MDEFKEEALSRLKRLDSEELIPKEHFDSILEVYTQCIATIDGIAKSYQHVVNTDSLQDAIMSVALDTQSKMAKLIGIDLVHKLFGSIEKVECDRCSLCTKIFRKVKDQQNEYCSDCESTLKTLLVDLYTRRASVARGDEAIKTLIETHISTNDSIRSGKKCLNGRRLTVEEVVSIVIQREETEYDLDKDQIDACLLDYFITRGMS